MKVKSTDNGNVKIVLSPEEANLFRQALFFAWCETNTGLPADESRILDQVEEEMRPFCKPLTR